MAKNRRCSNNQKPTMSPGFTFGSHRRNNRNFARMSAFNQNGHANGNGNGNGNGHANASASASGTCNYHASRDTDDHPSRHHPPLMGPTFHPDYVSATVQPWDRMPYVHSPPSTPGLQNPFGFNGSWAPGFVGRPYNAPIRPYQQQSDSSRMSSPQLFPQSQNESRSQSRNHNRNRNHNPDLEYRHNLYAEQFRFAGPQTTYQAPTADGLSDSTFQQQLQQLPRRVSSSPQPQPNGFTEMNSRSPSLDESQGFDGDHCNGNGNGSVNDNALMLPLSMPSSSIRLRGDAPEFTPAKKLPLESEGAKKPEYKVIVVG